MVWVKQFICSLFASLLSMTVQHGHGTCSTVPSLEIWNWRVIVKVAAGEAGRKQEYLFTFISFYFVSTCSSSIWRPLVLHYMLYLYFQSWHTLEMVLYLSFLESRFWKLPRHFSLSVRFGLFTCWRTYFIHVFARYDEMKLVSLIPFLFESSIK